jgi:hypothetical protein
MVNKEKEETKEKTLLVMDELPTRPYRDHVDEGTGNEYEIITTQEALTEILSKVRELHKKI